MNIIKFKRDTELRRQYFTPESFAHPAKLDAQLLLWIVDKCTQPGETILDPMAGSGTLMLVCTMGRNVVMVELEDKFVKMQEANWQKVRMMPQLGYKMGDCKMIQGDARNLELVMADIIITSPPYAAAQSGGGIAQEGYSRAYQKDKIGGGNLDPVGKRSYMPENVGTRADNIQFLPYGNIDAVITSPPYEEAHSQNIGGITNKNRSDLIAYSWVKEDNPTNIGNLKSESYLQAMSEVYHQCFKVLKDNGLMILITKNFIRNKEEVRLDKDTIKLCEDAGFTFKERWYRELPAQSFWRIIYKQKYPDAPDLKYEDVLVFTK